MLSTDQPLMTSNLSLYTITAALILDNEGSRVYAKYYQQHTDAPALSAAAPEGHYPTLKQQLAFEKTVFPKIYRQNQDILLYDNHLVTYKQVNDIVFALVAQVAENESLIYSAVVTIQSAISTLLHGVVDKLTLLKNFDLVALAIDETIDDGILLEIDADVVVSRVTTAPRAEMDMPLQLNEKSIFGALSFASKKIGERLQQGL